MTLQLIISASFSLISPAESAIFYSPHSSLHWSDRGKVVSKMKVFALSRKSLLYKKYDMWISDNSHSRTIPAYGRQCAELMINKAGWSRIKKWCRSHYCDEMTKCRSSQGADMCLTEHRRCQSGCPLFYSRIFNGFTTASGLIRIAPTTPTIRHKMPHNVSSGGHDWRNRKV